MEKNKAVAVISPPLPPPPMELIPMGIEPIKARIVELVDLFLQGLLEAPAMEVQQSVMLESMGPLLLAMISQIETEKLQRLLICFQGISRAVLDLACSLDQYNDAMEPLLKELVEVAQSIA